MSKITQLEANIREVLPELQEITRGCKLTLNNGKRIFQITGHENDLFYIGKRCSDVTLDYIKNNATILGHDIILSDIFSWFNTFDNHESEYVDCLLCYWDMSKRYLKDQNKELIEYLHSLIK